MGTIERVFTVLLVMSDFLRNHLQELNTYSGLLASRQIRPSAGFAESRSIPAERPRPRFHSPWHRDGRDPTCRVQPWPAVPPFAGDVREGGVTGRDDAAGDFPQATSGSGIAQRERAAGISNGAAALTGSWPFWHRAPINPATIKVALSPSGTPVKMNPRAKAAATASAGSS
jgi:hypothetical protein